MWKPNWDLMIKGTTAIVAIVGVFITVWNLVSAEVRESRKPFLELQLRLYNEASKITAQLANTDLPQSEWNTARGRFWELYWGELAMVEEQKVATAMVEFGGALRHLTDTDAAGRASLRSRAIRVAHECRDSVQSHWGFTLPAIRELVAAMNSSE